MQALALHHMKENGMPPAAFFRNCYFWKFNKDITEQALYLDVRAFHTGGNVPPYAVDYLCHIYGAH